MTWSHYQQLRQNARARIQQKLAGLQPTGGNGVIIQGGSIAFDVSPREEDPPAAREAWQLMVLGRVTGHLGGHPGAGAYVTGFDTAAWMQRNYPIFHGSTFWGHTQMFEFPPLTDEVLPYTRTIDLELKVRGFEPGESHLSGDEGVYRVPVILDVEEYEADDRGPSGTFGTVIRRHQFILRRPLFKKSFKARRPGVVSYLRAVGMRRLR